MNFPILFVITSIDVSSDEAPEWVIIFGVVTFIGAWMNI